MTPRIILVPFRGAQDSAALTHALTLADAHDASVEAWHVLPDPERAAFSYPYEAEIIYPIGEIQRAQEANDASCRKAERAFHESARETDLSRASFHTLLGSIEDIAAGRARTSDLVVIKRDNAEAGRPMINEFLFNSGRPLLLLPPTPPEKKSGNILIAWNGSREAARAVTQVVIDSTQGRPGSVVERGGRFQAGLELQRAARQIALNV